METVGLAVGVVGLAGLFTSCIDCFCLVQRGRYLGSDYSILETKYTNQRLRLVTWGKACGFASPNFSAHNIDWNDDLHSAVSETLHRIAALFRDQRALRKRYGLVMDQSSTEGGVAPPSRLSLLTSKFRTTTSAIADTTQTVLEVPGRFLPLKRHNVRAAVRWAIDDRRKFGELVQHLKDFIDDLEALTADLNVRQRQRELIEVEVGGISDLSELEMIEEARMGAKDAVADAASLRLCQIYRLDSEPDVAEPIVRPVVDEEDEPTLAVPTSCLRSPDGDESAWDMVEPDMAPETDAFDMYYQVLHRVVCDAQPAMIFLDAPSYDHGNRRGPDHQWLVIDADAPLRDPAPLHLAGQRPLPSLDAYLGQNPHLSFLVIRDYKCVHDTDGPRQLQPTQICIRLISDALCTVLNSWPLIAQPPVFHPKMELCPPYAWFYHNNELLTDPLPRKLVGQRPLTRALASAEVLVEFVRACMEDMYNDLTYSINDLGCISWQRLPLLFRTGQIVVQRFPDGDDDFCAFEQTRPPCITSLDGDTPDEALEIPVARVFFSKGQPSRVLESQSLWIRRSLFEGEGDVALLSALPVIPLHLAHDCDDEYLIDRGRKAYEMSQGLRIVVYTDQGPDALNGEYLIDTAMFNKQHNVLRGTITPRKQVDVQPAPMLHEPHKVDSKAGMVGKLLTYMCMPYTLPGFHTRHHVWKKLLVRNIKTESLVHTRAPSRLANIDNLLIPEDIQHSLARLLGPMQLTPSWRWHRRQQLSDSEIAFPTITIAFHGDHLEAAARVASRTAERPLYRIRLSGHNKDLDVIFETAKALNADWNCIFLIEDFLEAYTSHQEQSSRLNTVLLPVLRFLDSFAGITVFLFPIADDDTNSLQYVPHKIKQRLCNSFDLGTDDIPTMCRRELWKQCLASRLSSTRRFPTGEAHRWLRQLTKFSMTWSAITSTVQAVVPQGADASEIDWSLLVELAQDQQRFKLPNYDG